MVDGGGLDGGFSKGEKTQGRVGDSEISNVMSRWMDGLDGGLDGEVVSEWGEKLWWMEGFGDSDFFRDEIR